MPPDRLYHLSRDGKLLGKYDEGVMRELLRLGKLRHTDDYWTPGMKAWAKLAILPPKSSSTARPRPTATSSQAATTPAPRSKSKIRWTKLWPIPTLVILALMIGYAASTNRAQQPSSPPAPKASVRKTPATPEPRRTQIEFTRGFAPFNPMGKELFPSQLIAFANTKMKPRRPGPGDAKHYGDPEFLAGVLIGTPRAGDRIVVDINADRFMRPSSVEFKVEKDAPSASAGPAPQFDYEALAKVRQTTPFNVTVKVRRNDEDPVVFSEVWQAHQINDCPTWVSVSALTKNDGVYGDNYHVGSVVAGFVNENHPQIDQILAEAKATGLCRAFVGYGNDRAELMGQLEAIWAALQKRGIAYSNVADSTHSNRHSFQHVRMLEQCLSSGQANCVDATAMMASVLKKIGLKVGVIFVPKHAYLVVYDQSGKRREFAIETTGLSNASLGDSIQAATEGQEHNLRKIESLLDDEVEEGEYFEVAIEDCRKAGIQPIPYVP
jgi:hypothetical protein